MEIKQRLDEIWSQDYIKSLPFQVWRGYSFAENTESKRYLITGFNPSFRDGQDFIGNTSFNVDFYDTTHDNYFSPVKKMLYEDEFNIDLRGEAAYADLFYFREQNQEFLQKQIIPSPNGIRFMVEQLNLTQHIIEDIIQPRLIVVKNKESWAYFGKLYEEKGWGWMGYKFEFVQNMNCGELFRVTGLLDSSERIAPEIRETNLKGSFVLFSKHINQFTPVEERPIAKQLLSIGLWSHAEKMTKEFAI